MTKTFRANPTNDKYKLKSRIATIESTSDTSTSDITLASSGGLEKNTDGSYKVKVSATGGFEIGSAGLQMKENSVNPAHMTNHHALDIGGLEMTTTDPKNRMKIKLHGTSLETSSSGLKLGTIPDNTIKPTQLDLSSSIFKLFCVERSSWTDFSSTSDINFISGWVAFSTGSSYYRPQYLVEKFNYYGGSSHVWYRLYLRGTIKKTPSSTIWVNEEKFAIITNTAYRPFRSTNWSLPFFDADNIPAWRQRMEIYIPGRDSGALAGYMSLLQLNPAGHSIKGNSNFDLSNISFDTLPNP
jgi:hypothetical protein